MNGRTRLLLLVALLLMLILYAPAGQKVFSKRLAGMPEASTASQNPGTDRLVLIDQAASDRMVEALAEAELRRQATAALRERHALPQRDEGTGKITGPDTGEIVQLRAINHERPRHQAVEAALEALLAKPVGVGLASIASEDVTVPRPGAEADTLERSAGLQAGVPTNADLDVGATPVPDTEALPSETEPAQRGVSAVERAAYAAQILAMSTMPMDTPQNSIIAPPGSQQLAPRYTGKLISLDLRGVDIRDFFRLIHQVSGLNIVVDADVAGSVTLVLDDVPWDQALDLVLKNNGLGRVLEGNVLRIATVKTLESEADETQQLQEARLRSEPLVSVVRRLRFASAEDQKPNLQSSGGMGGMGGGIGGQQQNPIPGIVTILKATTGVLSPRGSVASDPRDNAVVITDVPSQIPIIGAFIDKLDTQSKQLSIQVRVVLASSDFTRSLSSVLGASYHNKSGSTSTASGTGSGTTGTFGNGVPLVGTSPSSTQTGTSGVTTTTNSGTTTTTTSTVSNPGGTSSTSTTTGTGGSTTTGTVGNTITNTVTSALTSPGFGAFAITNAGARYMINAALSAAEARDQARTISRPTIVTQDNFPGLVMQGVQIPIQTSINLTVSVQYVDAALQMLVTPRVTGDNRVYLDINVNNASPGTISVSGVGISINVQQATTKVLVPDGGTVVFGGITVTTRSRSASYIPLLGSVPVLGNLFKSSQINDQNQELLFFVSPTVLTD